MKEGFKVVEELSIPSDFDSMHEVHHGNTHIQNVITLVSNFLGYSDAQKQVLRDKYKAEIASTTTFLGSTEFNCPCGQKFHADNTKKRRAICPHCNKQFFQKSNVKAHLLKSCKVLKKKEMNCAQLFIQRINSLCIQGPIFQSFYKFQDTYQAY